MMISAQKEVEIAKTSYNDLKRVRSIWICMGAADDEDSIDRIILKRESFFGNPASPSVCAYYPYSGLGYSFAHVDA